MGSRAAGGSAARNIAWMCAAHVISMLGFAAYTTLLPRLQQEWGINNSQAGFISGAFFAGYMAAVPLLTGITDRVDARRIYLVSGIVLAAALGGFAWLAQGFLTAALFQAAAGIGIAGTYMPGLRVLTDNTSGPAQSRAVSFYTAIFGLGTALSILIAGWTADVWGWPAAFAVTAVGPLIASAMVMIGMPASQVHASPAAPLLDFRPVLRAREVWPYIVGYAVHCWELFGSRSWLVAFCFFAQGAQMGGAAEGAGGGASAWAWSPVAIAAAANLCGPPASIVGNELALRFGRGRLIAVAMILSGVVTGTIGWSWSLPWFAISALAMLHMTLVMGDSSALTAGMVLHAPAHARGATMAVHSMLGFGAGFIAPLVFGAVLDLTGGNASATAWSAAFMTLGAGAIGAPWLLGFLRRAT
jgi:MFS family permease